MFDSDSERFAVTFEYLIDFHYRRQRPMFIFDEMILFHNCLSVNKKERREQVSRVTCSHIVVVRFLITVSPY